MPLPLSTSRRIDMICSGLSLFCFSRLSVLIYGKTLTGYGPVLGGHATLATERSDTSTSDSENNKRIHRIVSRSFPRRTEERSDDVAKRVFSSMRGSKKTILNTLIVV